MKSSIYPFLLIFLCSCFVGGCDPVQPKKRDNEQPVLQEVPPEDEAPVQDENDTITVPAAPGMTGRGNYASATGNNPMGIITVPVATMFKTEERLILMQIEHALNLYKAEHGNSPATHDEFMERIIRANNIQLPRLPAGHTYLYEGGELKIRKPGNVP